MELSQKKNAVVSSVSHELKTPLTAIRMYGEILMEGWVDEEKREGYYRHIHDESERLSRLIQNVLTLAQLEKSEWQSNLTVVDPVKLVSELAEKLRAQVKRAGFQLEVVTKGEPVPVQADQDALVQILINLIDNAIKFAADSRDTRIVLKVSQIGSETCISVRDFGGGIPPQELKKIFEKFYRVEDEMTRSTRGTGIGLALVSMLAKSMNATVDVRNRDPGAEFSIHIGKLP
jgi:signal transduction histidine kinase